MAIDLLFSIAMLLPVKTYKVRGRPPFDYRIVLVLSILRVLLRKRYADYEAEMRTDKRIMEKLDLSNLPCKATVNNYDLKVFKLSLLSEFNSKLVDPWIKKPVDLLLDASGIRIIGRSIWYCIRTKQKIKRKECDKAHIAINLHNMLIAVFRISSSKRNDSPFLRKLLEPFKVLGIIIADLGYSNKTNTLFVANKKGAFFSPFKKNACPSGLNVWNYVYNLWTIFESLCRGIYNMRNRVEVVFSALKKRYGDQLNSRKWFSRRRELAMRFIAYNVRIIIAIKVAREKNIPLWVRVKE
jgi:hypothetical protein